MPGAGKADANRTKTTIETGHKRIVHNAIARRLPVEAGDKLSGRGAPATANTTLVYVAPGLRRG